MLTACAVKLCLSCRGASNATHPVYPQKRANAWGFFLPAGKIKSASGGPAGGLSARARGAGGRASPAPQAESDFRRAGSSVRFARASVRRGGGALPRRAGGAALDLSTFGAGFSPFESGPSSLLAFVHQDGKRLGFGRWGFGSPAGQVSSRSGIGWRNRVTRFGVFGNGVLRYGFGAF